MFVKFLALTLVALGASFVVANEKVVICYYGTWATYRWGLGKFDVDNINPDLCSHVIYSFVGINNQGTVITLDSWLDLPDNWGKNNFGKFTALKQKNPKLKTLLAVGGWGEGSYKYSAMAANPTLRKNFITSALEMVLTHGFDGFDLDWEYPAKRDTAYGSADVNNFSQLVKEMREEFDKHGLLITAAVVAVADSASTSYDIATITKYLDYINLMTYDLYGAWDPVTGHNAPLYKGEGDENTPDSQVYTVDNAVQYWLNQGCPPEKLVIGVPFYGRSFVLSDPNNNGVRAPSSGAGISGPFTVTSGNIGYNEFCNMLRTESWDVRWDNKAKVPYAVKGKDWVSYDDPESMTVKSKYALSKNAAGIMMWSIESDDFNAVCGGEDFPLLRAINRALGRIKDGVVSSTTVAATTKVATTTPAPKTTKPVPTSTTAAPKTTTVASKPTTAAPTTAPPSNRVCSSEGLAPNPSNCKLFYMCTRGVNGDLIPVVFECPSGLVFNTDTSNCDYPTSSRCV